MVVVKTLTTFFYALLYNKNYLMKFLFDRVVRGKLFDSRQFFDSLPNNYWTKEIIEKKKTLKAKKLINNY